MHESVPRHHPTTRVGTPASAAPRIDRAELDTICNGVLICTVVAVLEAPVGSSGASGARYAAPNTRPKSWDEARENVAYALFALYVVALSY